MAQVRVNDYPLPAKDRDRLRAALNFAHEGNSICIPLLYKELKGQGYERIVRCPSCILYSTCSMRQFAGGYCGNGADEEEFA